MQLQFFLVMMHTWYHISINTSEIIEQSAFWSWIAILQIWGMELTDPYNLKD